MGKNARFKQGKKKFANNNKRPNEPAQAQPKPQPQPQQPQAKKQKQQPAQQPQQPQENKKHFVCKNYDGKHGLGCKRGDKCPFTHLNGEELLLFQQFRSCSCLCNPTLDHSEPYSPVAPPKQQQKQQPPQQKNKNAKNKDNEEPVTLIDCLCVIETPKAALLDKIKELSTCDSQQHQQDKFWLRFPLTNVAFTISKISNSKEANFVKKIYTEGVAPNDDASTMIHIEELDENGSPINPVELWAVLGELKHQACILRFLERRLQTEFLFLPCRNENYIDEYKSALWAHPVKNIEEESLKNAPPLLARIDEAREQTGILGDDDDDDEAAFNQYMKDAGIFDDDDDGFYDEDDDEEMDEEALDDEDVIDDDGDEDYEDIEDEDEEMAKMFGKRGGPSARMMEEMMMAMMMQNMAGRGGKRGGFNPFMGMMDDDEDDDDM